MLNAAYPVRLPFGVTHVYGDFAVGDDDDDDGYCNPDLIWECDAPELFYYSSDASSVMQWNVNIVRRVEHCIRCTRVGIHRVRKKKTKCCGRNTSIVLIILTVRCMNKRTLATICGPQIRFCVFVRPMS